MWGTRRVHVAMRTSPKRTATTPWDAHSALSNATVPDTASGSFTAQGLEYSVERRGDRVFHKETKRDAGGRVVSHNEAEARYVIGSGEQAMAFLVERGDGYLFEIADHLVFRETEVGPFPGLREGQSPFRAIHQTDLPLLPFQSVRSRGGDRESIPATDLPGACNRL